jgi:hypothetical protein
LKAQGGGRLGTQALIKVLENMNNHKIHKEWTNGKGQLIKELMNWFCKIL